MAKRKIRKRKRVKRASVRRTARTSKRAQAGDLKFALLLLIFGTATAVSAIYKMGDVTLLLGLVTAAAALGLVAKNR